MIYNLEISANLAFDLLRILLAVSLFFVWVVRYDNIVKEFRDDYDLPNWLRDLVGIIKLSCAGMILTNPHKGEKPRTQNAAGYSTINRLLVYVVFGFLVVKKNNLT